MVYIYIYMYIHVYFLAAYVDEQIWPLEDTRNEQIILRPSHTSSWNHAASPASAPEAAEAAAV